MSLEAGKQQKILTFSMHFNAHRSYFNEDDVEFLQYFNFNTNSVANNLFDTQKISNIVGFIVS